MNGLSHFDDQGAARMVDVGAKPVTVRCARASARIRMQPATCRRLQDVQLEKGDALAVSRLAGIMAAKRTDELIPLCHPIPVDGVEVVFEFPAEDTLLIHSTARATARTGVEMEALVAVSIAALTIYDMCKSIDRSMVIQTIQLEEKSGGQSGRFARAAE